MINEVQLIAWKNAIKETILYEGDLVGGFSAIRIQPIAGIVYTDLVGKWCRLTNQFNATYVFPIGNAADLGTLWSFGSILPNEYPPIDIDYSVATYQIFDREYIGNVDKICMTTGAYFRLNGDQTNMLYKQIQINLETGDKFNWVVTQVTYLPVPDKTDVLLSGGLFPPAPSIDGTWSPVFETIPYYLDLYPNESISQTWRFTDISNFGSLGSFTREFRLPATKTNSEVFGIVEDVNFNDELNYFHTKLNAEIRVNTFPIAIGHIRLMRTYTQLGKYSDLEISFYAETPDLQRAIGEKKLEAIKKLGALNHEISYASVIGTPEIVVSGNVYSGGQIGDDFIGVNAQPDIYSFIGLTIQLDNGTDTTSRVITSVYNGAGPADKVFFDQVLASDYSSGTFSIVNTIVSENVRYALVDRGQKWSQVPSGGRPVSNGNFPVYAGDLTPHLNAWWIFQNILKDAGFELNPTPLQSILEGYWCPWINSRYLKTTNQENDYLFRAQLTTNSSVGLGGTLSMTEIYDYNNNLAGSYFTPFFANYTFNVWVTFDPIFNTDQTLYIRLMIQSTGGGATLHEYSFFVSGSDASTGQPINVQYTIASIYIPQLTGSGSSVRLKYWLSGSGGSTTTPVFGTADYDPANGTGWELVKIENIRYGVDNQMNLNSPDVKQIDFIKDIFNMHCCAIVPDTYKPNVLNIVPFVDYINSGDTLDWTDKLDINKDTILNPTTDRQNKNLMFTYKNGGDVISKTFTDNGRTYGEYEIIGYQVNQTEPPNDFASGDLTIQLTAESNPCNYIDGTSYVISKYINSSGDFVNPNLRFVFMSDLASIKLYDDANLVVVDASINLTNHYSDTLAQISDYDLNFAPETPLHIIEANPYKNLFNLYWRDYLNELYSPKARILEAFFALDVIDIQSFSFSDKIWIKDSYWRILEISDYKIGMNESTKVVLIKTDIESPDCNSVPVSINTQGYIQFEDYDGNPVAPTAPCCNRYGYSWTWILGECLGTSDIFDVTNSSAGGGMIMIGQSDQPTNKIAMVSGSNVSVDNQWSTFVGKDITITDGNPCTTAQGDYLKLTSSQPASALLGSNTLAPIKGMHYGGGWRGARLSSKEGSQQSGIIILSNEYIFSSSIDSIEIAVGNETLDRLNLEDDTHWSCIMNTHVSDNGGFWASSVYTFNLWKFGGVAGVSNFIQVSIDDSIGNQFNLQPSIDVLTNTAEHRFFVQMLDIGITGYLYPTPAVNIVASIQYIQSR